MVQFHADEVLQKQFVQSCGTVLQQYQQQEFDTK
jgi:hypothetical protein